MKPLAALSACALCCFNPLSAAVVVWSAPVTLAGGSDVNTSGTTAFARNIGVASGATGIVNGVDFGYATGAWTIDIVEIGFPGTDPGFAPSGMAGPDASNYETILNTQRHGSTTGTLLLINLTPGQDYLIQIWVADYRAFTDDRTLTFTADGGAASAPLSYLDSDGPIHGQYIIGTFTADDTDVSLVLDGNVAVGYNAIQLREITIVPEPSSAALLVLGGLALMLHRRK